MLNDLTFPGHISLTIDREMFESMEPGLAIGMGFDGGFNLGRCKPDPAITLGSRVHYAGAFHFQVELIKPEGPGSVVNHQG